jgi:6-phosphofructokinase 1
MGSSFSIVAVSEGAMSNEQAAEMRDAEGALAAAKKRKRTDKARDKGLKGARARIDKIATQLRNGTLALSEELERRTNLESRVTILGHLQRGGTPSAADRLLATRLGAACARAIDAGESGVMIAARGEETQTVPLEEVVGKRKTVPLDHSWIQTARDIGTSLGDA